APAQPVCVKKWPEHVREGEFTEKFPHCTFSASEASCELKEKLASYEVWDMYITVKVSPEISSGTTLTNRASAKGGGVSEKEVETPLTVSTEPTPFGLAQYELTPEGEHGETETRAGVHPFQFTTAF